MIITLSATVVMVKNEIESFFFRGIITDALTYIKISRYRYVCDKDSIKRERESDCLLYVLHFPKVIPLIFDKYVLKYDICVFWFEVTAFNIQSTNNL